MGKNWTLYVLPARMFVCSGQSDTLALGSAALNDNLRLICTNRMDHSCSQRHLYFVRVAVENL